MHHHDEAVARYVDRARGRPEVLGVLVTGSVARGDERADSDVDLVVVVTDDAWSDAVSRQRIMAVETDGVGYEHGYFDVKLATRAMLEAVATSGDDPARDCYASARCVLDQGYELDHLLAEVRRSEGRRSTDLAASFVAQARVHGEYFLQEGARRQDPLLLAHAAVHLATSACRAVLALAGRPFPGPKQLTEAVRELHQPPLALLDAVLETVARPTPEHAARVLVELEGVAGWTLETEATLSRFVLDNELAWFTGRSAPEYR